MFYVLYDKDFKAIGTERATYPVQSYKLTRKAFEFDELTVKGMKMKNAKNAMFVALKDEKGKTLYTALSGKPVIENGLTKISAMDLRKQLDTEEYIDLTRTFSTVTELITYLISLTLIGYTLNSSSPLKTSNNLVYTGGDPYSAVIIDLTYINKIYKAYRYNSIVQEAKGGNVWDTMKAVCGIHDCYLTADVNIDQRILTYTIYGIANSLNIKLSDFDNYRVVTDGGTATTRAVCKYGNITEVFYRLNNEIVMAEPTNESDRAKIIYPHRTKFYEDETRGKALAKGMQELYNSRYKKNIEIDTNCKLGYLLDKLTLDYYLVIYGFNEDDPATGVKLPVMAISEDEKGNRKIKAGRLEEYWWL